MLRLHDFLHTPVAPPSLSRNLTHHCRLHWLSPMAWTVRSMSINELTSSDWDESSAPWGGSEPLGMVRACSRDKRG